MNQSMAAAAIGLLIGMVGGCSLSPGPRGASAPCTHEPLAQCEAALWDLLDQPERAALDPMLSRYLHRRADGWSRLYQRLGESRRGQRAATTLVLMDAEVGKGAPPSTTGELAIVLPSLPPPERLPKENLLLVLAEAAGYEHLLWLRRDGTRWNLYPHDPLRPFVAGLPAVMLDPAGQGHPGLDGALERELRQTLSAAANGYYVETAADAERLLGALEKHPACQTALRVRYALHLLSASGLVLTPEAPAPARSTAPGVDERNPSPASLATPYTNLLQIYLSREPQKQWKLHRNNIESALGAQRRDGLARALGGKESCHAAAPAVTGVGDLLLAGTLTRALAPPSTLPTRAELTVAEWLPRYRALVQLATATRTGWYFAPILAQTRGLAHGINPQQEPTYAQVTALMAQHLERLTELQQSAPQRFEASGVAAWLLAPDLAGDAALGPVLLALVDSTVRGKLASGSDVATIFEGLLSAGLSIIALPPQARLSSLQALQRALAERLHGDLREQSGWSVAALYALDEVYRQLFSMNSEIAESGNQILRALRDEKVPYPELSRLAQAVTLYGTLAATDGLDAELIGEPARFGSARREAYEALRASLATLTPLGTTPPPAVTTAVASWADGFLALLPLYVRESMAAAQRASQTSQPGQGACQKPKALPRSAAQQRAIGRLLTMRQRLLAQAWYAAPTAASPWAPRLRTLILLLSDGLDLAQGGANGIGFAISTATATAMIKDALHSGAPAILTALAEPTAELYGWLRSYLSRPRGEPGLFETGPTLTALRAAIAAAQRFLQSPGAGVPSGTQDSLLSLLRTVDLARLRSASGLPELFAELSTELYGQGQTEAGEGMLLLGLFADLTAFKAPSDALVQAAVEHRSPLLPLLQLYQSTLRYRSDLPFDPKDYRARLRELAAEGCQEDDEERTLDILQALADYARRDRAKARAALRKSLERAEQDGLVVPRLTYHYVEQVGTRLLQLQLDLSLGGGIALTAATNQFSFGLSSLDHSGRELRRTLWPTGTTEADERAMRFYVHAATLYTIYSLLDGDEAAARWAGARVVTAFSHHLLLGRRGAGSKDAALSWDARAAIPLAAQLLAEAGQPLLASELWKEMQLILSYSAEEGLNPDLFQSQNAAMLGIAGIAELAPVIERTRASLQRLLPACLQPPRRPLVRRERSCAEYAVEFSLLEALSEQGTAELRPGEAVDCPVVAAFQPGPQHELMTRLRKDGQPVEAAEALLHEYVRIPREALAAAHELGRSPELTPWLRVAMLEGPVLLPLLRGRQPDPQDLAALLHESARVPGLETHGRTLLRVVDYAAAEKGLGLLRQEVEAQDFVTRWLTEPVQGGRAEEAATALLLQHAAAAEAGHAVALTATQGPFNLLCGRLRTATFFDGTLRGTLCAATDRLRHAPPASLAEGQQRAHEVYRLLAEQTAVFKR